MGRLMLLEYRNDQKYTVKMMSFLGHDWFFFAVIINTYFFKLPIQN